MAEFVLTGANPQEDDDENRRKRKKGELWVAPDFHNSSRKGEDDVFDFWKFAEILQNEYGGRQAINAFSAPTALKFVKADNTPENAALGGQAIKLEHSSNTIHFHEEGHVKIQGGDLDGLAHDAALSAAAIASNPKVKSVEVNGSDVEKVIMFYAARNQGITVDNEAEVLAFPPDVQSQATAIWTAYQNKVGVNSATPVQVTSLLDKRLGELAAPIIRGVDNNKAAGIQADILALYKAEDKLKDKLPRFRDKIDAKALKPDVIDALKAEAGITEADVAAARAVVDAGGGVPDEVPVFGQILEAYDLLDKEVKNALLIAQAANRTLQIADRINSGQLAPATEEDANNTATSPMFGMVGRFDDEPADLVHAQSINAKIAHYEKQIAAGMLPEKGPPKIAKGYQQAAIESMEIARERLYQAKEISAAKALDVRLNAYKDAERAAQKSEVTSRVPESIILRDHERTSTAAGEDPADILETFDKRIGDIAEVYANADNEAVAVIQADLLALVIAEGNGKVPELPRFRGALDAKALKPDVIDTLKAQAGITDEDVADARVIVDAGKSVPNEVPKFGQILDAYGLIEPAVKDSFLAIQAAVRTLEIAGRINGGTIEKASEADVYAAANSNMFGMVGRFADESASVVHAQAMNAKASVYEKQIAAGMFPEKGPPKIAKGYTAAAIQTIAIEREKLAEHGQAKAVSALDTILDTFGGSSASPAASKKAAPA